VGANETAHPTLATSGPYLPSLSLAPPARHHLRQEPYAGNPPVRICAGGTAKAVSLPRQPQPDAVGSAVFQNVRSEVQAAEETVIVAGVSVGIGGQDRGELVLHVQMEQPGDFGNVYTERAA
jgi:hypothetical protein